MVNIRLEQLAARQANEVVAPERARPEPRLDCLDYIFQSEYKLLMDFLSPFGIYMENRHFICPYAIDVEVEGGRVKYLGLHQDMPSIPSVITPLYRLGSPQRYQKGTIEFIPESIERLEYLEQLWITDLGISKVPEVIANLKHLTSLRLPKNNLEDIPKKVTTMPHLETLDLESNKLRYVPPIVEGLKMLRLEYNNISSLNGISEGYTLECLNLHGNPIKKIPRSIFGLPRLKTLYIGRHMEIPFFRRPGIKVVRHL